MYRIEKLVPLIGSTVAGPLGVVHLPRMWYKSVLSAAGMLWPDYFDNDKGLNHRVVESLSLEPDAWFAFLATMPTYPQAEDYVKAHATKLDPESIAALNAHITSYDKPEERASEVRARVGLHDPNYRNNSVLLDLEDWFTIHQELVAHRTDGVEPMVPMVSSGQVGIWGLPHLPRLWIKALLNTVKALPADWKTGINCGFDKKVAGMIGLDLVAAVEYIETEFPNYLEFERWVLNHIAQPDESTKMKWTEDILGGQKAEEQSAGEVIEAGAPGLALRGTVLLNDMVDWKHMRDDIVNRRVVRV